MAFLQQYASVHISHIGNQTDEQHDAREQETKAEIERVHAEKTRIA